MLTRFRPCGGSLGMVWDPPQHVWLPGGRLHLHQGPIDLVIGAEGPGRRQAFDAAIARFDGLLAGLAAELPSLRTDIAAAPAIHDPIGQTMAAAVRLFQPGFITPMAAVAGAVADAVLAAMTAAGALDRAYVNNGGDIAICLAPGRVFTAAIAAENVGRLRLTAEDGVGGIATSGWRGRSHSLGIADAVTVLATTAVTADAAATMIANAVDLPGHPAVSRTPAHTLYPESDLGARPVTVGVGPLAPSDRSAALDAGAAYAKEVWVRGHILAACLQLGGDLRFVGAPTFVDRLRAPVVSGAETA